MDKACNTSSETIGATPSETKLRKLLAKIHTLLKKPVSLLSLPTSIVSQRQLSILISLIFMKFPAYFYFVISAEFEYVTNISYKNLHYHISKQFLGAVFGTLFSTYISRNLTVMHYYLLAINVLCLHTAWD